MVQRVHPKTLFITLLRSTPGSVAAITGIMLTVLLGLIAFSVDLSRLILVKSEMQRGADSGALAGARALVSYTTGGGVLDNDADNSDQILWKIGLTVAKNTMMANKVEGLQLTDFDSTDIKAGWWDLKNKTWKALPFIPAPEDRNSIVPGIWVTITKAEGKNGGPVNFNFGSFVGKESSDVSVQAIAALPSAPVSAATGGVFPLAVPESKVTANWDKPNVILSNQGTEGVQFTSFFSGKDDTSTIGNYMKKGNDSQIEIGKNIYVVPGDKAGLYGDAGAFIGKVVLIPVVTSTEQKKWSPVKGFVAFYIDSTNQGGKTISGHFVRNYVAPGTLPGDSATTPFWGVYSSSAKLIQ